MLKGFKQFILRGNVIDMAVGRSDRRGVCHGSLGFY